jgi:hypothetical protein
VGERPGVLAGLGRRVTSATGVTLFIDPFSRHFLEDRLFDPARVVFGGDDIHGPWIHLRAWFRERGVEVFTADRLLRRERADEHNVYVSFGIERNAKPLAERSDVTMSALFLFEGPIVEPSLYSGLADVQDCFRRVYSFSDEQALAPFLERPVELRHFCLPSPVEGVDEEVWENRDRGFLVMVNGNRLPRVFVDELYTERLRALAFFAPRGEIDLYGIGWNDPPYRPYPPWVPNTVQRIHRTLIATKHRVRPDPLLEAARSVYRGATEAKCRTLGGYRFALCYENQILKGWITEKIFDCLRAGTVPVYWGAPDIEDYVPAECLVDRRRFASYDELREFLHSVGPAEVDAYREAGRAFLSSEAFYPFSKQAFVDRCAELVAEDTGVRVT